MVALLNISVTMALMAVSSAVTASHEQWEAVAAHVSSRRLELGLSQAEAVAASGGGVSLAVWSILENARQQSGAMRRRPLRAVALALQWPPDAVERIIAGEEPDESWATSSSSSRAPVGPVASSVDGVDFAELARLDPDGYAALMAQAQYLADRARARRGP